MDKKIENPENAALKKLLYSDPNANFRIKVEDSKKQFEKARYEGNIKQVVPSNKISAFLNEIK